MSNTDTMKKRMTAEQWDRIENAMREFEQYEKKVKEYLLFLTGGMRDLSRCGQIKSFDEAPEKIKQLKEEFYSIKANNVLKKFIFFSTEFEFEDVTLNKAEEYRRNEMHWKWVLINSHVMNWLNAASIYLGDYGWCVYNNNSVHMCKKDNLIVKTLKSIFKHKRQTDVDDVAFSQSVTLHVMKEFLDSSRIHFYYDEEKARQTEIANRDYLDKYEEWIKEGWEFPETDADRISSINELNHAVEDQAINRALIKFTDKLLNDFF